MEETQSWFTEELERRGVSRRDFMGFCGVMASVLALPRSAGASIAEAIETKEKPTLVWLEFQDCAGNTESFLRVGPARPSPTSSSTPCRSTTTRRSWPPPATRPRRPWPGWSTNKPGGYIAVVEGSIPTGAGGAYCTIGGRAALDIAREVCGSAAATIAIGTCAAFGGLPAAAPNPTGALSVADAVPGVKNLINLPACPANVENLVGAGRLLPDLRPLPGARRATAGRCSPTASRSTTTASGAPTTTPASTSRRGATRATAPATACTRWAARGR